jgi:low affinity Fe/Cu permease
MARTKRKRIGAAIQHPADRTEGHQRGRFERLAERASFLASSPHFFFLCALVVLVWAVGLAFGASDRFETGAAGLMSAMTLGLVALLKNAELRSERAIQRKLDAIANSLLEDKLGSEREAGLHLERSIRVHEEI